MSQTATSVIRDGVAVITLDHPLVNALSAPLRDEAIAFAQQAVARGEAPPRIRDRIDAVMTGRERPALFATFATANAGRFKRFDAPAAIVEAVEAAVTLPFDEGLAKEAALFNPLVAAPQSIAQRHAFFAERVSGIGAEPAPLLIRLAKDGQRFGDRP